MFKNYRKIGFLGAFILLQLIAQGQEKWSLRKYEKGIAVYSRLLNNSKFKEIKVVCEFNCTTKKLISILQDVNNHKNWVYSTIKSSLIRKLNPDTLFYYSEISIPWPFMNRDATVQLSIHNDSLNHCRIIINSIPTLLPKFPNLIRVPYSLGIYEIKTLSNNHIRIDYTLRVDPGGTIPAWLVNWTATIAPYSTFVKLRQLAETNP